MKSPYTEHAASGLPNTTPLEREVRFIQDQHHQMYGKALLIRVTSFSTPYQLIWTSPFLIYLRGVWCTFSILFYFEQKFLLANIVDPDQTPHSRASDLCLYCLPRSEFWEAMHKGIRRTENYQTYLSVKFCLP